MRQAFTIVGLIAIGIIGRLIPHPPNTTPITAITLSARKQLGAAWAFAIPLLAMLLSDFVIGFYNWKILASVYLSFGLVALLSQRMKATSSLWGMSMFAITGSLIFFISTNFSVWLFSPWYEKSISGLLYCYTLGLPFLLNSILGDVGYTMVLVGVFLLSRAPTRRLDHTKGLIATH